MTLNSESTFIKEPLTIREAMKHIHKGEYLLPAIQRKFVWSTDQICLLFDSEPLALSAAKYTIESTASLIRFCLPKSSVT